MKFLVISLAGIGDTFFATPLIHELRLNYPDARIDTFVRWRGSRDLLQGNPHLTNIYQKDLIKDPKAECLKFLWQLRQNKYDISFNTHPQSRIDYRIIARLINAKLRLSHAYERSSVLDDMLVNRTVPQDYSRHCINNNLELLKLIGSRPLLPKHQYELFLSAQEENWAENFVKTHSLQGKKLLGIHVGSGGTKNLALRRWPLSFYVFLLQKLNQSHPGVISLLFGGPEEERDREILMTKTDPTKVLHPETANLRQAAALLRKCQVFLSVDTALMHVSTAVNVPRQIVIETPTWNKPIEPFRDAFVLVKNPAVGGRNLEYYRYDGKGIRGTPAEITKLMESVTVDSVYEAIVEAFAS
jgi:ADP-heptose:LPS heptosyltransferase